MQILKKKQVKLLAKDLQRSYNINIGDKFIFIKDRNKIFITDKDIKKLDLSNTNIKQIGLFFAEIKDNKYYLSGAAKELFLK